MLTRRGFFATAAAAAAPVLAGSDDAASILQRIFSITRRCRPPKFPDRDFDIVKFGAARGGATDCTAAISKAIAECSSTGGGRVVVPAGVFLTGAIHLKSNV